MSNSIGWGQIYCFTEFGDEDNTIAESIPALTSPLCFLGSIVSGQIETLALTVDSLIYKSDSLTLTADFSLV